MSSVATHVLKLVHEAGEDFTFMKAGEAHPEFNSLINLAQSDIDEVFGSELTVSVIEHNILVLLNISTLYTPDCLIDKPTVGRSTSTSIPNLDEDEDADVSEYVNSMDMMSKLYIFFYNVYYE